MADLRSKLIVTVVATAVVAAARVVVLAGVDVRAEFDKKFDFKSVKTWAWNPEGPGQVRMARTQEDDPEAMRKRAEPIIVDAVTAEMTRLGLKAAASYAPDVFITYYLLLTIGANAQTLGQFIPSTPEWGIPPFAPATQSLTIMNQGSLVLDVRSKEAIIWRGVAQAKLKPDTDAKEREQVIRESVRDLLRRFPRP
jgi:hypothetical protein